MKKLKYLLLIITLFITNLPSVFAASVTVSVSTVSNCKVNDVISVTIGVSNISGTNVAGFSGTLTVDTQYLQYQSHTANSDIGFTASVEPLTPSSSTGTFNLASYGSTGLTNNTTFFTLKFKAVKEGKTTITLSDATLSNTDGDDFESDLGVLLGPSSKLVTIGGSDTSGGNNPTESNDALLKALSVDNYSLSPAFSKATTSYTITVPTALEKIKVNAMANDTKALVSGVGEVSIKDKTKITITVTAEDGTTKTYTININRKDDVVPVDTTPTETKSNDATLKKLDPSGYTMSPTFKKNVTSYTIKVGEKVDSLDITALPTSDKAKVEITGNKNWKDGANEVKITVTAEDGTKKIYILNVMKNVKGTTTSTPKSSNTYLKELTINDGELTPAFNKKIDTYNITVPNTVDNNAKVEISGNKNLEVGINLVTITVTAEDGTKRVYTLNVTKSSEKSDTDLTTLTVSGGELSPKFDPNVTKYKMSVSNKTDKVKVTAIPKADDSTVTVEGNEDLVEGINTIIVKVKDKNGFVKYYEIEVDKKAKSKFLGLDFDTWLKIGLGILGLLLLGFFLFLIFRKKKKENVDITQAIPKFEFKPEFNFNSKNGTDDDIVEAGATLNQISGNVSKPKELETKEDIAKVVDAEYKEIPYDPYDEIVTKDELYDAILEAKETKDTTMLKMLLDQEKLNREKEEIRKEHSDNE